jgi:hypothetical protein
MLKGDICQRTPGDQIRGHQLFCSITNLHETEDELLDEPNLEELGQFTLNRSPEYRDRLLVEKSWGDEPDAPYLSNSRVLRETEASLDSWLFGIGRQMRPFMTGTGRY